METPIVLSRRRFLHAGLTRGGGLLVAASLGAPARGNAALEGSEPDVFRPSVYIEIGADGRIVLTVGKSEMGQGTTTGIAQLIADELRCAWQDVQVVQAPAAAAFGFPFNGFMITGGSSGLRTEWTRMREMGAVARVMLERAAAARWALAPSALDVEAGVVHGPGGRRATFSELAREAARLPIPDPPALQAVDRRTMIGKSRKRLDSAQKIAGKARYGIDVDLPGLMTAVLLTPPRLSAPAISIDATKALTRPGVRRVVPISTGVAIVGDHYWAVHSTRDAVDVTWGEGPFDGVGMATLRAGYRGALDRAGLVAEERGDTGRDTAGMELTRTVEQPYLAHACMEPMNFTVAIGEGKAEVWGPTQAQSMVQRTVARVAGIEPGDVAVHTTFLGGGFGRRSAQDFVQAAAEIALATRLPVKLVFSREDDMRAGRYRPMVLTRATARTDAAGELTALDVKTVMPSVAKWSGLDFLVRDDGVDGPVVEGLTDLPYAIPNTRVEWVEHDPQIPVHFWRAVGGSHNPFVIETLLDDVARASGKDPLELRRALLKERPRHLAVLDRLADEAGWSAPPPAGTGRGMALVESFDSIVGEVVELRLVGGTPVVDRVVCVIDCGVAINPGQIEAQMQGSIVFGLSAFLRGAIQIEGGAVQTSNFHDYPPLRMDEMPEIAVSIVQGADAPGGVGEPGLPPVLPAAANALRTLGVDALTRLPFRS